MGMSSGNGRQRGAMSDINVTPLVDVMLVLLIVFMVTTPIIVDDMRQRNVDIDLPPTNAAPVTPDQLQTILTIRADFSVGLDLGQGETQGIVGCADAKGGDYATCLAPLEGKLKANETLHDGRRLFIMADRNLPYGFVLDVMARVKNAGILNVGMVTNPPGGTEG